MATVKGQNLRIFLSDSSSDWNMVPIAAALSCTLDVQLNVKQYSTKDDTDDFARNEVVNLTWSVKAQVAIAEAPQIPPADMPFYLSQFFDAVGQTVFVQLALTNGSENREMVSQLVAGEAIISDVQATAENRQRGIYEITLTGKKNMLFDLRRLRTADGHFLRTYTRHILAAAHEEV